METTPSGEEQSPEDINSNYQIWLGSQEAAHHLWLAKTTNE